MFNTKIHDIVTLSSDYLKYQAMPFEITEMALSVVKKYLPHFTKKTNQHATLSLYAASTHHCGNTEYC